MPTLTNLKQPSYFISCDFSGSRIWTGFGQVVLLFHGLRTVTLWYSAGTEVWRVKDGFAHILVLWWGWWKDWAQLGLLTGRPTPTCRACMLSLLHGGLMVISGLLHVSWGHQMHDHISLRSPVSSPLLVETVTSPPRFMGSGHRSQSVKKFAAMV